MPSIDRRPDVSDRPLLILDDLHVRYGNGALGVSGVSMTVRQGQVVVLWGPNGAGKTTTVRAVSGFFRAEGARVIRGSIQFDGRLVTNHEPHEATQRGITLVPERQKIFPSLTVTENLEVSGRRQPQKRRRELQAEVFEQFPALARNRTAVAGRLSGGQQQMLAIARSLIHDARLLIIDEITLGLHASVHESLFEIVRSIAANGRTLIIVDEGTEHALQVADRCYVLEGGLVRAAGRPEEFIRPGVLADPAHRFADER